MSASSTDSWDQVIRDFNSLSSDDLNRVEDAGRKLIKLDEQRATTYLISSLPTNQPAEVRKRAIRAIAAGTIKAAIPQLIQIALNTNEVFDLRYTALNPGLQNMKDERAAQTAKRLLHDPERHIRIAAYWVLSGNPSNDGVKALGESLATCEPDLRGSVILALLHTGYPESARIVFDLVPLDQITDSIAVPYCSIMTSYEFSAAQDTILKLMQRNANVRLAALAYFERFPRVEVSPFILQFFESKNSPFRQSLEFYPMLWIYATSPNIAEDVRAKLRVLVQKFYPEAKFDNTEASQENRGATLNAEMPEIIKAVYRYEWEKPKTDLAGWMKKGFFLMLEGKDANPETLAKFNGLPFPVHPGSEYMDYGALMCFTTNTMRWVTGNQLLVRVGLGGGEDIFLVVRKEGHWSTVSGHNLWIE